MHKHFKKIWLFPITIFNHKYLESKTSGEAFKEVSRYAEHFFDYKMNGSGILRSDHKYTSYFCQICLSVDNNPFVTIRYSTKEDDGTEK